MIIHTDLPSGLPLITVPGALMHELRTPLGHIIGYTELLIEQAAEGDPYDPAYLEKVRAAGWLLLGLLDERFRSDRSALAPAVSPLERRVRQAWWMGDASGISLTAAFKRVAIVVAPRRRLRDDALLCWESEGGRLA